MIDEIKKAWKEHKKLCWHGCRYFREFESGYMCAMKKYSKKK